MGGGCTQDKTGAPLSMEGERRELLGDNQYIHSLKIFFVHPASLIFNPMIPAPIPHPRKLGMRVTLSSERQLSWNKGTIAKQREVGALPACNFI